MSKNLGSSAFRKIKRNHVDISGIKFRRSTNKRGIYREQDVYKQTDDGLIFIRTILHRKDGERLNAFRPSRI